MDKPIQPPLLIFEFMYNNSNPFLWFQSSSIFVLLPVIIPFFFFTLQLHHLYEDAILRNLYAMYVHLVHKLY